MASLTEQEIEAAQKIINEHFPNISLEQFEKIQRATDIVTINTADKKSYQDEEISKLMMQQHLPYQFCLASVKKNIPS